MAQDTKIDVSIVIIEDIAKSHIAGVNHGCDGVSRELEKYGPKKTLVRVIMPNMEFTHWINTDDEKITPESVVYDTSIAQFLPENMLKSTWPGWLSEEGKALKFVEFSFLKLRTPALIERCEAAVKSGCLVIKDDCAYFVGLWKEHPLSVFDPAKPSS